MAASSQVYEDLQRKSCRVEKRNGREEEKVGGREGGNRNTSFTGKASKR